MSLKVEIRLGDDSDATLLADLGRRAFEEAFGPDNTLEDMTAYLEEAFSPAIQAEELRSPGSTFLIAETEEQPIGYVRLLAGSAPACITGRRPVEIVRFYLLTPWIGRGIGAQLMQACLEVGRGGGHDVAWLGVWQKNARAIAFYQKAGFTIAGVRAFQLGSELQQDWLMQRSLE